MTKENRATVTKVALAIGVTILSISLASLAPSSLALSMISSGTYLKFCLRRKIPNA